MKRILVFFILLLLILPSNVLAIAAMGKLREYVEYVPNKVQKFTFRPYNMDTVKLRTYVGKYGDYTDYITVNSPEDLVFNPGSWIDLEITIIHPPELPPGRHMMRVGVRDAPPEGFSGMHVGTGVAFSIFLENYYPYEFLEIREFNAMDAEEDQPVVFELELKNFCLLNITTSGIIEIFDSDNNKIGIASIPETFIKAKNTDTIKQEALLDDAKGGIYRAVAKLNFGDGNVTTAEKSFRIGRLQVELDDVKFDDFKAGEIGKFFVDVKSVWNNDIKNVYVEIEVLDENGEVIKKVRSPGIDLGPWDKGTITLFMETSGLEPGEYDARIVLYYGDDSKSRDIKFTILAGNNWLMLIIIVTLIVVVSGIAVYIKFGKSSK